MPKPTAAAEPDPVLQAVRSAWQAVLPFATVYDDRTWADTGGDSLDVLKMFAQLESYLGHSLDHDFLDQEMTPRTLASRIKQTGSAIDGGGVNSDPGSDR